MLEKERQCEAFIESKKCLDFILNEVEKDIDKSYMYNVLCLQSSNSLFINCGSYFPLKCIEYEYYYTYTIKITEIFCETKAQSDSNLWVKIRNN